MSEAEMGWVEGFEPSTTGTTIRRSTKLSYAHREYLIILSKRFGEGQTDLFLASSGKRA